MASHAKRVLDVGQCGPDHAAIRRVLVARFGVEIDNAFTAEQALQLLRERVYDLILVNRILDLERTEGLDLVRQIKGDAAWARVPVMLISNLEEAQQQAMAAGAVRGFGKNAANDPATEARLQAHLEPTAFA